MKFKILTIILLFSLGSRAQTSQPTATKFTNGLGMPTSQTPPINQAGFMNFFPSVNKPAVHNGTAYQYLLTETLAGTTYQPLITAGTTLQYYRGDKTFQTLNTTVVPEGTNLYATNARSLLYVLTGYTSGTNMPLTATTTYLDAFKNLQAQINADNFQAVTSRGNSTTFGLVIGGGVSIGGQTTIVGTPVNPNHAIRKRELDSVALLKQNLVTLTTTGSGAATFNQSTGALNIPTPVTSTGTVTSVAMTTPTGLTVTGSPITTSGTLAVALQSGYSIPTTTDQASWTVKQPQLNGTGFVKASGTTISYDNTAYYAASNPNGYTSNTGTVTSLGRTDGIGIVSSVANATTTPVHTVAVDTTVIRTVANSLSLSAAQTKYNLKANLSGGNVFSGDQIFQNNTATTLQALAYTFAYGASATEVNSTNTAYNRLYTIPISDNDGTGNGFRFRALTKTPTPSSFDSQITDLYFTSTATRKIKFPDASGTVALTSNIEVGTLTKNYITATGNYVMDNTEYVVNCVNTITVSLPSSVTQNRIFVIKNFGTGVVTVQVNGSAGNIDNVASIKIPSGGSITVQNATGGSDYSIIASNTSPNFVNTSMTTTQTSSTLNTAYPNASVSTQVTAPNVGTGMKYEKVNTTSGGTWIAWSTTTI